MYRILCPNFLNVPTHQGDKLACCVSTQVSGKWFVDRMGKHQLMDQN